MNVPFDIIIDLMIMPEGDLPINAIHAESGYKAELFFLRDNDEYRRVSLSRRQLVQLSRSIGEVYVHSPEDLIVNKVYYFSLSQQTKHVRDIASIIAFCGEELDVAYIEKWTDSMGVLEMWQAIRDEAEALWGE